MKKLFLIFILMLTVLSVISCGGTGDDGGDVPVDVNPDSITVETAEGLNEQIYLNLPKGEYVISYKAAAAEEYILLDKELMLDAGNSLDCYILGLAKGLYDVKIEQGEGEDYACRVLTDIDVEKQDRSGYAHFGREEGVGGYNNDGTVKEGAKILYVSNATKNTVELEINGTTYTGLVAILGAKQYMEEPLIIRVLDRITTNQWKTENGEPQVMDYTTISDGYFEGLFSDSFGENLAGLPAHVYIPQTNKTYEYVTTPDGIYLTQITDGKPASSEYNRSLCYVENAKDITVEGVGKDAGFYQFGVGFHYSDSIEIKNLTFARYPHDALQFKAFVPNRYDSPTHGRYWIHSNTFETGSNSWVTLVYGDDEDLVDGDECIDIADVRNVTMAYNKFQQTGKTIIIGGWEYDANTNITLHHNFYLMVRQRLPLSRNANIHSYNNYYADCWRGPSPRTSSYLFGEANYFENCESAYDFSEAESKGAIKSWGEIYKNCGGTEEVVKVSSRDEAVENTCKADWVTDHSRFDTDPELFYYDAENGCSDVDLMLTALEVPDFVPKYAGAGVILRLDLSAEAE